MHVIQEANEFILEVLSGGLKEKTPSNDSLKISNFVLSDGVNEGTMLYNLLTKEVVLFEDGDYLYDDYFYRHFFVIDEDIDEFMLAEKVKYTLYDCRLKEFDIKNYTVITTTECNARCFYCYEKGNNYVPMSEKVANDAAEYMMKTTKDGEINIMWFGGEPFHNKKAIDIITGRLRENNREFKTTSITNGYYFDKETAKKAAEEWNLESVQITIDGLSETYKKAKNYKNDDTDPLNTVMNGIKNLLNYNIFVIIRINVGFYNVNEVFELVDYIKGELSEHVGKFSIYPHKLFDGFTTDITEENESLVYEKIGELESSLIEDGIYSDAYTLTNNVYSDHCMADDKRSVVIQANGDIGLCEHFVDSEKIGSIYKEGFNEEKVREFEKLKVPFETCSFCMLYPECNRLEKCEDYDNEKCSRPYRDYFYEKTHKKMKKTFEMWKELNPDKTFKKSADYRICINENAEPIEVINYEWN